MRALITLCAVLLLSIAGCSKTSNNADRDAAAPSDQTTPSTTPGDTGEQGAPPAEPSGTPPPEQTAPPPDQTTPPNNTDTQTTPPAPPPNQ
ncbi:MAG TPA: hypothetical protein VHK24_01780 [Steroidobacter sp.]|jgi:hypothetical protein|nr:hypothetical protein [Steroidobacter sp.]